MSISYSSSNNPEYNSVSNTSVLPMGTPFFSVVIPLYNKEKNIGSTIDSVLNQTFSDFELIVVDDGSTDRSAEIVASYDDPRIRLIKKENGGVSSARNRGVKSSVGHYLYFLDADDIMVAECLEKFNELVEIFPSYNVYASNFYLCSNEQRKPFLITRSTPYLIRDTYRLILIGDLFLRVGNNVIRREYAIGHMFNEEIDIYEDLDYFLRIVENQVIPFSPECLYVYCLDNASLSVSNMRNDQFFAYHADLRKGSSELKQIKANNVVVTIWSKFKSGRVSDSVCLLFRHIGSLPLLIRAISIRILSKR